jgi:protein TonB
LIFGAHALLLGAVMTARMDLPGKVQPTITKVDLIEAPKPPPPPDQPPPPEPKPQPRNSGIDQMPRIVPIPQPDAPQLDRTPIPLPPPLPSDPIGNATDPLPIKQPASAPLRVGPRFATPADLVRPPYPDEKRRLEEEAVLQLRLSIDERGRVVAVEPVGAADPAFLGAARKHLIAYWRYKPATEDGRPIAASTVVTLRFELEE